MTTQENHGFTAISNSLFCLTGGCSPPSFTICNRKNTDTYPKPISSYTPFFVHWLNTKYTLEKANPSIMIDKVLMRLGLCMPRFSYIPVYSCPHSSLLYLALKRHQGVAGERRQFLKITKKDSLLQNHYKGREGLTLLLVSLLLIFKFNPYLRCVNVIFSSHLKIEIKSKLNYISQNRTTWFPGQWDYDYANFRPSLYT